MEVKHRQFNQTVMLAGKLLNGLQIFTSHHQMGICNMTRFVRLSTFKKNKRFNRTAVKWCSNTAVWDTNTACHGFLWFRSDELQPWDKAHQEPGSKTESSSSSSDSIQNVFTSAKHYYLNQKLSWLAVKWSAALRSTDCSPLLSLLVSSKKKRD